MIFTFYKAKGLGVGKSILDKNALDIAKFLGNNEKIVLPPDIVIADDRDNPAHVLNVTPDKIPSYMFGLDVGKGTIEVFKSHLASAKMVVWNGPLGYYENERFAWATNELLRFLADHGGVKTIIGGGDTVAIVEKLGLNDKFFHVSTGGGASMELLEGKDLPGIEVLRARVEK
jgi:phosphoglycerate kinase